MKRPLASRTSRPKPRPIVVPAPSPKRFYGHGIPGVPLEKLTGKLIVVEGADGRAVPRKSSGWCNGWKAAAMPPFKWA